MTDETTIAPVVKADLGKYKREAEAELQAILSWWMNNMVDRDKGGFYATVSNDNTAAVADKGVVLNSRILWAFSSAYNHAKQKEHLHIAQRAFDYILKYFIDLQCGGVYWSVDTDGKIKDDRKQVYGLAFCMYGLAEYYKVSGDNEALFFAKELFAVIEKYSWDKMNGGYIEAFTREWNEIADMRLSEKDDNERKTMNTHLHIIEAYANLFSIWPDSFLKQKIEVLLEIFDQHIINKKNHHLNLFMDDEWNIRSSIVSFGHDIEAAWLLLECAETIGHDDYMNKYRQLSVQLANAAAEGIDKKDGGLWYEYEPLTNHWIKEKHSWPQAEAMVGFFNAYQTTGDRKYLRYSINSFDFAKQHLKDDEHGEWFWGIEEDGTVMQKEKAGFWKCPYHNSRACIEIIKRISTL
jgi:mannobiose 2-epimerase